MRLTVKPSWVARPPGAVTRRAVRVCFVIDRLSRAGTETQLLALLRHLDRSKVRPSLCLLSDGSGSQLIPSGDCPVLQLGLKKLVSPAAAVAATRLARFWRRQGTNVVVTYFLDSTYFAVPIARLCGIRRIVRVRNNAGYWLTPLHRRLGRMASKLCHFTLTNSEAGHESVLAADELPGDRVRVLQNGVDLDRFPVTPPSDTGREKVRIGALANLRPVKNIDGLVRVAAEVCRSDPRVRFDVAGEGEQKPALEAQIRAAELADRFSLRGAVADVPGFLGSLDVAVLCSHSESMSNALLEYMAAGRAIVATDVGSNATVVRHEREGLIVPPRDDQALQDAIKRLLAQPTLARSLAIAARNRVAAEFSRDEMVRRFEDFFVSLVKG